jgi:hypothetical protein
MMLEFRGGIGKVDFEVVGGLGIPHGGLCGPDLLVEASVGWSLFHRFDSVVAEPFLRAFRKEPFFSEGFEGGLSFDFFVGGDFVTAAFFWGGWSLIEDAALIGFLVRF